MEKGIKPILGFEAYIAPDSRKNRTAGVDGKSNHLILLAKNDTGWKNLMRLSSIGYLEGFYYKPRIDMEVIREHSEGLIATTACIAGSVPRAIIAGDRERAKKIAEEYLSVLYVRMALENRRWGYAALVHEFDSGAKASSAAPVVCKKSADLKH